MKESLKAFLVTLVAIWGTAGCTSSPVLSTLATKEKNMTLPAQTVAPPPPVGDVRQSRRLGDAYLRISSQYPYIHASDAR